MKRRCGFCRTGFTLSILLAFQLVTAGCGGVSIRKYIHPDADMSFYKKVGVIPFRNLSSDRLAGTKLTETFVTELMIPNRFEVAPPGEFRHIVQKVSLAVGPISEVEFVPAQLKKIAKESGVQGIFMGTVQEYEMTRIGQAQYPVISLNVRFVDAETGTVVWQESYFERGGPKLPVLAIGEIMTLGELSQRTCRHVMRDFYHSKLF